MTETTQATTVRERLLDAERQMRETFIRRDDAIRVVLLSHLAGVNYLFVGTPGTAKTAVVRSFARHITGAKFFDVQVGSFTTPGDLFGEFDIEAFKRGIRKYVTAGMMPEADLAFVDEALKAPDGLLNMLLRILNERLFAGSKVPLLCAGAATNWPELERRDDVTDALFDRFLLRVIVDDLSDPSDVAAMLGQVDGAGEYQPRSEVSLDDLRAAMAEVRAVTVAADVDQLLATVRDRVAHKRGRNGELLSVEVPISSRRLGALRNVLRASAWLDGRDHVNVEDFEVLKWGLWVARGDTERVATVLDRVDASEVRKVVEVIDRGQQAHLAYQQGGGGLAAMRAAIDQIRDAASEARALFERPVYTRRGREEVRSAMRDLRTSFESIRAEAERLSAAAGGQ